MATEFGGIDIDEMGRVIDEAGVIVIEFKLIPQRLLVDARASSHDSPLIRLVPPVNTAEERYRYLQQTRPNVPLPDQITVLTWPRYVDVMKESGLWTRLERRLIEVGGPLYHNICNEVLRQVRRAERAEVVAAIFGSEGFETLWERATSH